MKDNCVVCGKETEWGEREVIHNRRCYVKGMGQLCDDCYVDAYSHETPAGDLYETPEDIAGRAMNATLSELQRYDVFKNPWDTD